MYLCAQSTSMNAYFVNGEQPNRNVRWNSELNTNEFTIITWTELGPT